MVTMKKWKWLVIINGSCLLGILVSLFIVPTRTPFWIWAIVSGVALILANALFLRREPTARPRKTPLWGDIVISLGFFALILDLLFRYASR